MATNAAFASTPRNGFQQVSTANTNRDGSGTVVDVFVAGASGSRVDKVGYVAAGTVTNGVIRWFLHNGTTGRLILEQLVTSTTPSTTVAVASGVNPALEQANGASGPFPMLLPTGWKLQAATNNAEAINVWAQGGDF